MCVTYQQDVVRCFLLDTCGDFAGTVRAGGGRALALCTPFLGTFHYIHGFGRFVARHYAAYTVLLCLLLQTVAVLVCFWWFVFVPAFPHPSVGGAIAAWDGSVPLPYALRLYHCLFSSSPNLFSTSVSPCVAFSRANCAVQPPLSCYHCLGTDLYALVCMSLHCYVCLLFAVYLSLFCHAVFSLCVTHRVALCGDFFVARGTGTFCLVWRCFTKQGAPLWNDCCCCSCLFFAADISIGTFTIYCVFTDFWALFIRTGIVVPSPSS